MRPGARRLAAATLLAALACSTRPVSGATPAPPPQPSPVPSSGIGGVPRVECRQVVVPRGVVAATYRSAGGGCVPPGRLVAVRCASDRDPIIVRHLGRVAGVFLGGRFAVRVPSIPADAVLLGEAATERVWLGGGQLYVEGSAGVTRWLRVPGPDRVRPDGLDAWMVGDSIMDGATPALLEALPHWDITTDAEVGRQASGGASPALSAAAANPDAVVVELGTNDVDPASFRVAADAILGALDDVPLVVWVVPRGADGLEGRVADQLRAAAAPWPNVATADWAAAAPADAFAEDGVHLLPERQGEFADFLAPSLLEWLAAVRGLGPARCLRSLAAA